MKSTLNKKIQEAHELARLALLDKPKSVPAKGFQYIENVTIGLTVENSCGLIAIVIDNNAVSTSVLVIEANGQVKEDKEYYLGKHRWGNETEVKVIGD